MAKSSLFRECMELSRDALDSKMPQNITAAQSAIKKLLDSGKIVGREAISLRGMRRSLNQSLILTMQMEPHRIFAEVLKYLDRIQCIAAYKSKLNERRLLRMQQYLDYADEALRQFGTLQLTFDQLALFRPKIHDVEHARVMAIQSLNILQTRFSRERKVGV